MKLSDFDYFLPKELIAQHPLKNRDSSRLMVLERKTSRIEHHTFSDITDYLDSSSLLVLNNTKVLPCRLFGSKPTGGKVELLLLGRKQAGVFRSLIKPGRLRVGDKINFSAHLHAFVSAKDEVTFNTDDTSLIYKSGVMPLPPYIKRETLDSDTEAYQTVYATEEGAVASPTAGLHFTKALLDKIKSNGASIAYVTLHVGLGTFKPVKSEDIRAHKMEEEYFNIPVASREAINDARSSGKRIFAVGTTSLRSLEAFAADPQATYTDLFIYPGYKFKLVDALITNFHLPRTTLFMLVCAFAGASLVKQAYEEAVNKKYRFYSYGDAMLIL